MKLLDYINQNLGLNEEDDGIVIEELLADWLLGWLQENTPMYSSSEEMFQDLVSQLQNVTHDMIGLDAEDSTVTAPLGLNFNHNGPVADAVISELGNDLQNYLQPRDEYGDLLPEDKNSGYYLAQKAADLWHEDNPDKKRDDFWRVGVDVQDEYAEKAGGKKGKYLGKGASEWTIDSEDEADEPLIPNIVNDDGEIVANDWDSAIELAQQNRIDADDLEFIEKEQDSSSLLDFLGGFYDIEEPVEEPVEEAEDPESNCCGAPFDFETFDGYNGRCSECGEMAPDANIEPKEPVGEDEQLPDTVVAPEDEAEDNVAKMVAVALGDESRWDEMSAHELYSELESVDAELADVIKMTAKLIHDVDLTESKAAKQS